MFNTFMGVMTAKFYATQIRFHQLSRFDKETSSYEKVHSGKNKIHKIQYFSNNLRLVSRALCFWENSIKYK